MKSIDKLKRLTGEDTGRHKEVKTEASPTSFPSRKTEIEELRRRMEAVVSRARDRGEAAASAAKVQGNRQLGEVVPGEEIENEYGRFFLAGSVLRRESFHGCYTIREAYELDMAAAALLAGDPSIGGYCPADALFLDTETTGLAGGTGTMAFLIGLGWLEEGRFHIRQILARDFGEEKAALAYLRDTAAQKKFLVTFNGKAFDINLLSARFILNRLPSDLAALPHLDLLHPSRRILGHRLENCRLSTLEEEILGVQREDDIPGWEIPQRYFDWLKRRDPRLLAAIFEHNRLDVISMATLTAHLGSILSARADGRFARTDDYLEAARLLQKRCAKPGAEKILDTFGEETCAEIALSSKKKLAQLCKQAGRMNEAARIWRQVIQCLPADFYSVSELAKWLEHGLKDYAGAKETIEQALAAAESISAGEKEALNHRLRRLNAKLQK